MGSINDRLLYFVTRHGLPSIKEIISLFMFLHIFPYFNVLCIVGGHKKVLLRDQPAGRADNSVEFDKVNSEFNT